MKTSRALIGFIITLMIFMGINVMTAPLPFWKRAAIVVGIGLITLVQLMFNSVIESIVFNRRLKIRLPNYERDRYCKLTCEGGSERGECKCERPNDCEKGNFKR